MHTSLVIGGRRAVLLFAYLLLIGLGACDESPTTPADAVITIQPADQSVTEGASATFAVTASNATAYQWQSSAAGEPFVDIAGASSPLFTTPTTLLADDGKRFRVIVSGESNSVTSTAATLTVDPAPVEPSFTLHPDDQEVIAPATATFTVAASGVPAPTLQWQVSSGGGAFSDIAGATGTSHTTAATTGANDGDRYRVIATNVAGSATTEEATLTVIVPVAPSFTEHPQAVTVQEGQGAQMAVAVTGTPTPSLQWQVSTDGVVWGDIAGETGATLHLVAVALTDDGSLYRAIADNGVGAPVASGTAMLTVTPAPLPLEIVTTSPLPPGQANAPYTVTLVASGGTPPYEWSDPAGSLQPGWTLDPSTGQISGMTAVASLIRWTIRVTDSASPAQTAERDFDLEIQVLCDQGFGTVTVAGAPPSVQGELCPEAVTPPGEPNQNGVVFARWQETHTNGGGSYFESVTAFFDGLTGEVESLSFNLNDATNSIAYLCVRDPNPDYPMCNGLDVDVAANSVSFENVVVGSGASPVYTLNGELRY